MLANLLALAVGLGSLALYMVAFFFPEVHRKNDFIWSGIGLFYALILWFCAGRITGAVLLGQMASVALLGWFGWQTFILRRQLTPVLEQTKISTEQSLAEKSAKLTNPFTKKKDKTQQPLTTVTETPSIAESDITETESQSVAIPNQEIETASTSDFTSEVTPIKSEMALDSSQMKAESEPEQTLAETTPGTEAETDTEIDQTTTPQTTSSKKGGGFSQLLTPVSGIFSNIKNAIQTRGSKKIDSKSTATSPETEKSTSEEVISETNAPVTTIQETQPEAESVIEAENSVISDIQTEKATFAEVEETTTPFSETESISVEEVAIVENNLESTQTKSPSTPDTTTQSSETGEEKFEPVSSQQKTETDDLLSESSKDKTQE